MDTLEVKSQVPATTTAADLQNTDVNQALLAAQRIQAMKRWKSYGYLALNIVGQVALGAAGCVLMFKLKERQQNNAEQIAS